MGLFRRERDVLGPVIRSWVAASFDEPAAGVDAWMSASIARPRRGVRWVDVGSVLSVAAPVLDAGGSWEAALSVAAHRVPLAARWRAGVAAGLDIASAARTAGVDEVLSELVGMSAQAGVGRVGELAEVLVVAGDASRMQVSARRRSLWALCGTLLAVWLSGVSLGAAVASVPASALPGPLKPIGALSWAALVGSAVCLAVSLLPVRRQVAWRADLLVALVVSIASSWEAGWAGAVFDPRASVVSSRIRSGEPAAVAVAAMDRLSWLVAADLLASGVGLREACRLVVSDVVADARMVARTSGRLVRAVAWSLAAVWSAACVLVLVPAVWSVTG